MYTGSVYNINLKNNQWHLLLLCFPTITSLNNLYYFILFYKIYPDFKVVIGVLGFGYYHIWKQK